MVSAMAKNKAQKKLRTVNVRWKVVILEESTEILEQKNMTSEFYFKFNSRLDTVEERIGKLEDKFVERDSFIKLLTEYLLYIRHCARCNYSNYETSQYFFALGLHS